MPNMVKRYKILNAKQCTMCSSGAGKCACIIFCASFVRLFVWSAVFFLLRFASFFACNSRLCQYLTKITTFFHSHIFHIATCHASICEKARKNKCSLIVCGTRPSHRVFFVLGLTETVEVEMIHTGVNEPQQQSSFILHVTAVAAAATMTVKHGKMWSIMIE